MMWSIAFVVCLVGAVHGLSPEYQEHLDLVNRVNKAQNDWVATTDVEFTMKVQNTFFFHGICEHTKRNTSTVSSQLTEEEEEEFKKLPKSYDVREKWGKKCPIVKHIGDQASCGSCWAFGSSEAMSDRICIKSNGKTNVQLSAAHLTFCDKKSEGCDGSKSIDFPYEFYEKTGIVSGGDYGSDEGCWPYSIAPSSLSGNPSQCKNHCRKGYKTPFKKDKHYGKKVYHLESEKKIMLDIFKNGPVSAGFDVYEDFPAYHGGVYYHTEGIKQGAHAIKILGWGVEEGTKYWLCANSWGSGWGLDGYFKIKRGNDECQIESHITASLPK